MDAQSNSNTQNKPSVVQQSNERAEAPVEEYKSKERIRRYGWLLLISLPGFVLAALFSFVVEPWIRD